LSFVTGIRLLIGVGGALLVAAGALAARRDDLLARQFARAPGPWTGTAGARMFAAIVIAVVGVGWLVIGIR
jgi:hypothetical protein